MAHELPKLPYAFDALEPHIDSRTMEIHHTKHHNAYVTNLNAALEGHADLQGKSLDDLMAGIDKVPEKIRTAVRNNGGGHWNHTLFWTIMKGGSSDPVGKVADAINKELGGFADFQDKFSTAAKTRFGSGWAWLSLDGSGKLVVSSTPNQDNPLMSGHKPILGLDVWEHAYYLNYQNRRPDYVKAWWNVVNWEEVNRRYEKLTG